ncbi:hypothetical protein EJB05_21127 [Eragrostis curvula]|uniref:Uncharacterized protein n=1 Tax=Eragrostis curvula TaxID=38414 RepID=A0A5J9V2F0_9POAL|nr:hypothetical protein EJB05_21127 [Eragrostis curvula]
MARPRSRLLDLESDDVFYGDHTSVAVHAIVPLAIFLLIRFAAAGFPHDAAVFAVLYGAYYFLLDRHALLGFLCWAASGVLAARLGFSTGWKVLHTFVGCQSPPGLGAASPPPSLYTSARRASTGASAQRDC